MVIGSYDSCKSDSEIFLEDSCFPNFDGKGPKWTGNGIFYAFYNLDITLCVVSAANKSLIVYLFSAQTSCSKILVFKVSNIPETRT